MRFTALLLCRRLTPLWDRDGLMNHLRPFAQEGKEVTEADIRAFFDARMNGKQPS